MQSWKRSAPLRGPILESSRPLERRDPLEIFATCIVTKPVTSHEQYIWVSLPTLCHEEAASLMSPFGPHAEPPASANIELF